MLDCALQYFELLFSAAIFVGLLVDYSCKLILVLKSMKGISVYRRPQVIKLSTLLDFYETDPHSNYKIFVSNGIIKTVIEPSYNQCVSQEYEPSQQSQNIAEVQVLERGSKKSIGLFTNVIKNMDTNRKDVEQYQEQKSRAKRPYQFYFQEFSNVSGENCRPLEGATTKRVKERATGMINIGLKRQQSKSSNQSKENKNQMNAKQHITVEENSQECGKQAFVDINFSFEQINQQIEAKKSTKMRKDPTPEAYEIKVTEVSEPKLFKKLSSGKNNQKSNNQGKPNEIQILQAEGQSKEISIPKSLISDADDFSLELDAKKQLFSPIPHKSRHQIRMKEELKVNFKTLLKQSRSGLSVQGAKKAQSRIYNKYDDSKDIKIDFDLDIDF